MLFNKNNVRKANDKKVLHKVHKNWIVVSTALLLAIGGGAVAAHTTTANADNTGSTDVAAENNTNYNVKPASDGTGGTPVSATQQSASASKSPLNDNLIMENNAISSLAKQGENADQIVANVQPSVASYNSKANFNLYSLNGSNASVDPNMSSNSRPMSASNNNSNSNNSASSIAAPDAQSVSSASNSVLSAFGNNNGSTVFQVLSSAASTGGPWYSNGSFVTSALNLAHNYMSAYNSMNNAGLGVMSTEDDIMTSARTAAVSAELANNNDAYTNNANLYYSASSEASAMANGTLFGNYASGYPKSQIDSMMVAISNSASAVSSAYTSYTNSSTVQSFYNSQSDAIQPLVDHITSDSSVGVTGLYSDAKSAISAISNYVQDQTNSMNVQMNAWSDVSISENAQMSTVSADVAAASGASNGSAKYSLDGVMSNLASEYNSVAYNYSNASSEANSFSALTSNVHVYLSGTDKAGSATDTYATAIGTTVDMSSVSSSGREPSASANVTSLGDSATGTTIANSASSYDADMNTADFNSLNGLDINSSAAAVFAATASHKVNLPSNTMSMANVKDSSAVYTLLDSELAAGSLSDGGNHVVENSGYMIARDAHNASVIAGLAYDKATGTKAPTLDVMPREDRLAYTDFTDIDDDHGNKHIHAIDFAYNPYKGVQDNQINSSTLLNGGYHVFPYIANVNGGNAKSNPIHVLATKDTLADNNFAAVHLVDAADPSNVLFTGIIGANHNQSYADHNALVTSHRNGTDTTSYAVQSILIQNGLPANEYTADGNWRHDGYNDFNDTVNPKFVAANAAVSALQNNISSNIITIPIIHA